MATSHQFIDQQQILNGIMAATNGHGGNDQKVEAASGIGGGPMIPPFKKRRKRTNLDSNQKMLLDAHFRMDPRPDNSRMNEIARILDLDQDVVRVWFCNRRQKLRKV